MNSNLTQAIINDYFLSEQTVRIFVAVLVALIAYWIFYRFVRHVLRGVFVNAILPGIKTEKREKQIRGWILFFDSIGGTVIIFSLLLFVLSELNFNISPILTGAGIVGLVIGLGSQAIIKDIIGGFFILFEGQYCEGDDVKIAGLDGKVQKITLRRTILITKKKDAIHTIPNGEVKTVTVFRKKGK